MLSQVEVDVRLGRERGVVVAQVDLEAGKIDVWLLGLGWLWGRFLALTGARKCMAAVERFTAEVWVPAEGQAGIGEGLVVEEDKHYAVVDAGVSLADVSLM